MSPRERIAILDGIRTPMAKVGTFLRDMEADELGAVSAREILQKTNIDPKRIDEVIIGNVAQPAHAANVGRVIALKAGVPIQVPAITVHRNCASGMEAITTGMNRIHLGESKIVLAGGVESMSNIPLLFNKKMTRFYESLFKAKSLGSKLRILSRFRPSFLTPIIGLMQGLTDPTCDLIMGMTAENLSRDFKISREEQDAFALRSHQLAEKATKDGRLAGEIVPVPVPPAYKEVMSEDNGFRENQTIEALQKLKPYFDRKNGTVTVGNASQITDGSAAVLLMSESQAKAEGHQPLGYVSDYAYAGCEPARMGLGPIYASSKLLEKTGRSVASFDLIEINEAFAAQVIANFRAFESDEFAKTHLGRSSKLGEINPDIVNVNGGAIALGHPLGMSGMRLVITLLKELSRRQLQTGLATLCIGGGQGAALLLERE